MKRFRNKKGMSLVATMMISLLFLSIAVWYANWMQIRSKAVMKNVGQDKAYMWAESGVQAARQKLKSPNLNIELPIGQVRSFSSDSADPTGRYAVTLARTFADTSLVEGFATGYFFIPKGAQIDPLTSRPAQVAVLRVKFRFTNPSQFLFALPNDLTVDDGTNLASGKIYGNVLKFEGGAPTQVREAFYFANSMAGGNPTWTETEQPSNVTFSGTANHAQRMAFAINFAAMDESVRTLYQSIAAPTLPTFTGVVHDDPLSPIYYSPNALDIGLGGPLTVSGVYVIYSKENVTIYNDILMADNASWVAILSEKDIRIHSSAPSLLTLNANFFANNRFYSLGGVRNAASNLTINGGVVCLQNISIGNVWHGTRTYNYKTTNDPRMKLPNFADVIEFTQLRGKSN